MLQPNMPYHADQEGDRVPAELPPVVDAHVHLFPQNIFTAVWRWFDAHAWRIRYRLSSTQLIDFLLSRGVRHVVGLQYAHKPGIARQLNHYMLEKVQQYGGALTGLATVFPGEEGGAAILQEAFDAGLKGVKLHVHVQCCDINDEVMLPLYECCLKNNKPMVIHAGREPKSTAYGCDPYQLCGSGKVERVLRDFPKLKICVPHFGFDESEVYRELLEGYDNLWLDTTMVLTDYFVECQKIRLNAYRPDRIMYGSDFPNIPYAWDRELKELLRADLSAEALAKISAENAVDFFGIDLPAG